MRKIIVVVEDDLDLRQTLLEVLQDEGFEVLIAADGREGLEILEARRGAAVVLLDLAMPRMNGLEFLRRRLESPTLSAIPVIIVSGDSRGQSEARTMGFSCVLSKPFGHQDLLRLLSDSCPPN